MAHADRPTPLDAEIPGGWIETPVDPSRHQSYIGSQYDGDDGVTPRAVEHTHNAFFTSASESRATGQGEGLFSGPNNDAEKESQVPGTIPILNNQKDTAVESRDGLGGSAAVMPVDKEAARPEPYVEPVEKSEAVEDVEADSDHNNSGEYAAIKPAGAAQRPQLQSRQSKPITEDDLFRALSRRRTGQTGGLSRSNTAGTGTSVEEEDEINNLMSKMFGRTRQEGSEEEKTRHQGVIFKHLTVKGMGIGAALQPTVGTFFTDPIRFAKNLFTKGPRKAAGKPPVRTLIDDFSGCIKPGEMCLVLGRPGAGCSTFLKIIGNQRFGFEDISGDVSYGGTDAEEMRKKYRSEVLYNPEDDLHYATLKVKQTLKFALKTRTPGKASRNEGESRKDYVNEFLRVVTKLFWIEHTMNT